MTGHHRFPCMLIKILVLALVLLLLLAIFYPRAFLALLRRVGRSFGDLGRAGREIASGQEVEGSPLARYEVKAGELLLLKVEANVVRTPDTAIAQLVDTVGRRVASVAQRREIPYRFAVIEDEQPNAFAVPGGAIFVTRSLVDLCESDVDALAGVIGHEIAHIDRRHAIYRLATSTAAKTGAIILTLGRALLLRRIAGQMEQLLVKGYGREQEYEADTVGSDLARRAGYDPRGLGRLLARLAETRPESGQRLEELLQYFASHPPLPDRCARLRQTYGG